MTSRIVRKSFKKLEHADESPGERLSRKKAKSSSYSQASGSSSSRSIQSFQSQEPVLVSWSQIKKPGARPDSITGRLVFHPWFETLGGVVIAFNFVIMTIETHATATDDDTVLKFCEIANTGLFIYYTTELALRLFVLRCNFFRSGWNFLDFFIVVEGLFSETLKIFQVNVGVDKFAMLKSLRMIRLLRLMRLFVAFRELYVLVAGIGRCMKTLFWASGLIFICLNVWAILSVEFLDQKVKELLPSGVYSTCTWCGTAFSNIWYSNVTWFQIISTADWATIGRPLTEEFFWPYAFFVVNVFIVAWGLLNIIVAAIVDSSISAREDDVAVAARIAEQTYAQTWHSFAKICAAMDVDGSGDISVKEFKSFLVENIELQQHLTIMGIRDEDVVHLLRFMTDRGDGVLDCDEFIGQFTAMRTLVEKTSLFFLLSHCESIQASLAHQTFKIQTLHTDISAMMTSFAELVHQTRGPVGLEMPMSSSMSDAPPKTENGGNFVTATFSLGRMGKMRSNDMKADTEVATASPVALETLTENEGIAAAAKTAEQELRTTARQDMPRMDSQRLPLGWYYFGASLPPAASEWCKSISSIGEGCNKSRRKGGKKVTHDLSEPCVANDVSRGNPVITGGQGWEPLSSEIFRLRNAKHVYTHAPIDDVDLPPEVIECVTAVDVFMGSFCCEPSEDAPTVGSRFFCLRHAEHMYSRAPTDKVDFPQEIIDCVATVDKFMGSLCRKPSKDDEGPETLFTVPSEDEPIRTPLVFGGPDSIQRQTSTNESKMPSKRDPIHEIVQAIADDPLFFQ